MKSGVGAFNKSAKECYVSLPDTERERLKMSAETVEKEVGMTSSDIMKAGAKAFKKIHKQVN